MPDYETRSMSKKLGLPEFSVTWGTIRNFGRVRYFNLSYVVIVGLPVIVGGYEIISNSADFSTIEFQLPLNLKLLYAANLCYVIAISLYQFFCPPMVKSYENDEHYVDSQQALMERAHPDRKYEIVLANLLDNQDTERDRIITLMNRASGSLSEGRDQALQELNNELEFLYPSTQSTRFW